MKKKKMILVIIGVVIVIVGLYFGASWLIDQMQAGQIPGHVRPPH
ncbi:MAG: hypothetical protein ACOY46_06510 [Bacillota bacterium]